MHEATLLDLIIVALLILDMGLTIGTFASLAARIRDLHDEVLAAKLARNDLDRRTLGDPRHGNHRSGGEVR